MSNIEERWALVVEEIEALDLMPEIFMDQLKEDIYANSMYFNCIFKWNKALGIKAIDVLFDAIIESKMTYYFSEYIEFMISPDYSNNKDKALEIAQTCFDVAREEEDCDEMRDLISFLEEHSGNIDGLLEMAKDICPDDEYDWE